MLNTGNRTAVVKQNNSIDFNHVFSQFDMKRVSHICATGICGANYSNYPHFVIIFTRIFFYNNFLQNSADMDFVLSEDKIAFT